MAKQANDRFLRVGPLRVDRDAVNLLTQLGVRNLREAMTAEIGQPLDKPGLGTWRRRSRVVLHDLMGGDRVLYLKRFLRPPLQAQVERVRMGAWGHGTAWTEWSNIQRLEEIGVPTMRPIAFAEKVAAGWEVASLLCSEQVPGESLERWLPVGWQSAVETFGAVWRRQAVSQLAGIVQRMHAAALFHRDLYTSHVFVQVEPDGRTLFHLIDLQRMLRARFRQRRWRVKDLAALAGSAPRGQISRTDRMRFLKAYLGPDVRRPEWKHWWRDVATKASRMMRHHEARMARLGRKG